MQPMKSRTVPLTVLLFGLCAVLSSGALARAGDMDAQAKVLAKLDDDWSAAAAKRDANLVASFYAADAVAYPPNGPAAVGYGAAKKIWTEMLADPNLKISWKTSHAEVGAGGELGYTAGTYELSTKGADGKFVNDTGKYLCVWKKGKDGKWKAIHDMWNSDLK
jgi:ketosteroid isomerase-like protein